jgi:hypothetical protein
MAQRSEKLRNFPLADVKAHPEIITDLLAGDDDVSVVLEKHGNTVRFAAMRTYDKDSLRILEQARDRYAHQRRPEDTPERKPSRISRASWTRLRRARRFRQSLGCKSLI